MDGPKQYTRKTKATVRGRRHLFIQWVLICEISFKSSHLNVMLTFFLFVFWSQMTRMTCTIVCKSITLLIYMCFGC